MMARKLMMILGLVVTTLAWGQPSAGSYQTDLLDPTYTDMSSWATAGIVTAALSSEPQERINLQPGDDLAAAVSLPGRVIQLSAGVYPVDQTLRFANRVILRGAGVKSTKLVITLRGLKPTTPAADGFSAWTTGLLLHSIGNSGIENLTVSYDDSLPPPPDPASQFAGYVNDPDKRTDLHVVLVRMTNSQNCWLLNCELLNSGDHPLMLEASRHLTIENTTIRGTYNRARLSGNLNLTGSEFCLLNGLQVDGINHVVIHEGTPAYPCRYNVIVNSRFTVDLRFRDADSGHNLIQDCVVAVPGWHNFPPISQGREEDKERPPGIGNLIYRCTVTRDFSSGGRSFSVADNPNRVYRVLSSFSNRSNVEDFGPSPRADTLWPVR